MKQYKEKLMNITITQLLTIATALLTLIIVLNTTTNLAIIIPVYTLLTELVHLTLTGQVRLTASHKAKTDNRDTD